MVSHNAGGVMNSGSRLQDESSFSRSWSIESTSRAITNKEKIKRKVLKFRKMAAKIEELNLPNAIITRIIKEAIPPWSIVSKECIFNP